MTGGGIGVPVLMYHSVDDAGSVISTAPSVFTQQMRWLHDHAYHVIPLSTLVGHLRRGEPLPDRAAVVTFDDGFLTVYTTAFPILAQFRFPATVFLVAGYCGGQNDWPGQPGAAPRRPLLSWTQVREMESGGIEFGGHTLSHPRLDRLRPEQIEREVIDSKSMIEDRVGHGADLFAYPYGKWSHESRAIVGRVCSGACTTHLALVRSRSDPLVLSRIDAYYITPRPVLDQLPHPLFPAYLGVRRMLRTASAVAFGHDWK